MIARRLLPAVLAALASTAGASAQTPAPLTYRQIRALPPSEVAASLLRPDQPTDIERIETQPNWGMLPGALQVRFFHRPVPVGRDYCSQLRQAVVLFTTPPSRDVPDDAALRVQSSDEYRALARAPGCRLNPGQEFAGLTVDADVAMDALDRLAAAQTAAARHGRLPFRLSCRDEVSRDPNKCRPGPRQVLAHLPLDHACGVDLADFDDPRTIEITLCSDEALWTLRMRDFGTDHARMTMLWEDIPPF